MITRHTLSLGKHITAALGSRRLSNPNPTIFDASIRYLVPHLANRSGLSLEDAASGISEAADAVDADGFSPQEAALQEAVEITMNGLVRQFRYVKTTVMPFIGQVSADVLERIKGTEPKEPVVEEWEPSTAVNEPVVRELAARFQDVRPLPLTTMITSATQTDMDSLMQQLRTGIPALDDAIAACIAKLGKDSVGIVFDALFRGQWNERGNGIGAELYRVFQKQPDGWGVRAFGRRFADLAILTYVMVDVLADQPLAGTGLSLAEYESHMRALRMSIGKALCVTLTNYDSDVRLGRLIISAPAVASESVLRFSGDNNTIVVLGPVYKKYLSQGGSPEAIIGGCLMREPDTYMADYLAKGAAFEAQCRRSVAERDEFARKSIGVRITAAFSESIVKRLADLPTMDFPATFNRDKCIAALRQEIDSSARTIAKQWNTEEPIDVYGIVEGLVAEYVFNFVDAKTIIDCVNDAYAQIRAEKDSSEPIAAVDDEMAMVQYMAVERYLAKWCAANFPASK